MFKIEYLKAGVKLRTRSGLPVEVIKTGARIGPEFDSEGNIVKLYDIVVLIKSCNEDSTVEYDFIDWYSSKDFVPSSDGRGGILKSVMKEDYDLMIKLGTH